MAANNFLYQDLTGKVIGAAMEVHRILGAGFLEAVYEEALAHELKLRDVPFERQVDLQIRYKDIIAKHYRADFLIDGKVVLDTKAIKKITEADEAQILNYLKATHYRLGLVINFGASSLEIKRRIL